MAIFNRKSTGKQTNITRDKIIKYRNNKRCYSLRTSINK